MPTTQTEQKQLGQVTLVVKANGGSVTVEKKVDGVYVVTDTFFKDGGYLMQMGNSMTRITPLNGAAYEISL